MSKETFKRARAHIVYKTADGNRAVGVTTVLNLLAKPALIPWANRIGLEGIKVGEYVDALANIGTLAHEMVAANIRGEKVDTSEYSSKDVDLASNSFLSYLEWKKGRDMEVVFSEKPLVSEMLKYGGTMDVYANVAGKPTLIDLKTGKGIYDEMKLQVAAYAHLLQEHGHPVESVHILRIGRSEIEGFEDQEVPMQVLPKYFDIFANLLKVYRLKKEVGMR